MALFQMVWVQNSLRQHVYRTACGSMSRNKVFGIIKADDNKSTCGSSIARCSSTAPGRVSWENEAPLCRDSPGVGGFETRPYEDHSGVNHIGVDETPRVKGLDYPWNLGAPVRQIWDRDRSWD
ncbi:MAG: hypothetical protein NTV33_06300 [Coprothermobacterota bacterium]|nr:hypothetical protein [Coprothermobacterota bacterium]